MNRVLIIAEAGVNHNGSLQLAKELIDVAASAGVDFVKFQTFSADELVTAAAAKADYQKQNAGEAESQRDMLKKLELSRQDHFTLRDYALSKNTGFLSTAFDLQSIQLLQELGISIGKIPSGEISNYPYLVKMASAFQKIILSTGMSNTEDIRSAIEVLIQHGIDRRNITVLHCNTEYPTPMADVNLLAMKTISDLFGVSIGYSDHTEGIEVSLAAVSLGATVIEKHFTLDKNLPGPDHKASLGPDELRALVRGIRNIEKALGTPEKKVTGSEKKNKEIARKSIVAKEHITKGQVFTENNLTTKRPGTGISAMRWPDLMGKVAARDFLPDELIDGIE